MWRRAGAAAVGVYALHLSALALCAAVIAAGVWVPRRLTAAFWWTRPVWVGVVLGVTGALVALATAIQRRLRSPGRNDGADSGLVGMAIAVALTVAGGAAVGLEGPRTPGWAVLCTGALLGAWVTLREPRPFSHE